MNGEQYCKHGACSQGCGLCIHEAMTAHLTSYFDKRECERLRTKLAEVERERDTARSELHERVTELIIAEARAERLETAIRDYLNGNYEHPRTHRPHGCDHGRHYFETCEECIDAHFSRALEDK